MENEGEMKLLQFFKLPEILCRKEDETKKDETKSYKTVVEEGEDITDNRHANVPKKETDDTEYFDELQST